MENLTEGQTFQLGSYTIGEAEILEFAARRSDPHATGGTGAHLASPGMIWPPSNAAATVASQRPNCSPSLMRPGGPG
ncbi:hypothetical protein [Bradyrhizobium embrapense]|uniref:hypothetical protein n=1 Tax=Bradyrhizobium embrapense TaxID=630921 RepID=UPI000AEF90A6|nr:hypothetical protein [Bradyrhizobium embrapense]